jgi:DNA primase
MKFDIIEWCEDNINNVKLNSSKQLVGDCPWCGKSGHFYVDSEEGHYICFACGDINPSVGKYMIGLIAHVEGVSKSEARKFIMRNRVEFRRKETPKTLVDKISKMADENIEADAVDYSLPPEFIPVYRNGKWSFPVYLKERGVKKSTAKEWGLGWARKGRYGGRVIIPVSCPNGNSFTARDVTGDQDPKYLNPTGADHGRLLLGWEHHNIKGDVVIVEGPMDAIKLWQHGFPALALMGKVLHVEQMVMLASKPYDTSITIMLDPEESEAPYNVAEQLICRFEDVSIAKLPDGVDPGASTKSQASKAIYEAVPYRGNRMGKISAIIGSSRKKLDEFYG